MYGCIFYIYTRNRESSTYFIHRGLAKTAFRSNFDARVAYFRGDSNLSRVKVIAGTKGVGSRSWSAGVKTLDSVTAKLKTSVKLRMTPFRTRR